jgi:hypothetical protein
MFYGRLREVEEKEYKGEGGIESNSKLATLRGPRLS